MFSHQCSNKVSSIITFFNDLISDIIFPCLVFVFPDYIIKVKCIVIAQ